MKRNEGDGNNDKAFQHENIFNLLKIIWIRASGNPYINWPHSIIGHIRNVATHTTSVSLITPVVHILYYLPLFHNMGISHNSAIIEEVPKRQKPCSLFTGLGDRVRLYQLLETNPLWQK